MKLYDYNTAERLTSEDLEITPEQYKAAINESLEEADNASGVIRVNGRRVYAA